MRMVQKFPFYSSRSHHLLKVSPFVLFTILLTHSGCTFHEGVWANKLSTSLQAGHWQWAFLFSYVVGFLTSLTPCVYPLIPITISLFGGRKKDQSRFESVRLAICYVLGISVMYTSLGIFSSLSGNLFGSSLSKPYVIIPISIFFLLMAASLLGAFSLQLPHRLQTSLSQVGGKGTVGAFFMGLVAGIIAAPCTGPPLLVLLAFVSTQHSIFLGGSLLFCYAIGIGTIFLFIAAFSLKLPKSGPWMEVIKTILALVIIQAALYYLRPIIPFLRNYGQKTSLFVVLHLTLTMVGVFVGGVHLRFQKENLAGVRKGIGILLITFGSFGMLSWFLTPAPLHWMKTEAAISQAQAEHRPLLIDFGAEWCTACKELDLKTFSDQGIQNELSRFTLLKVDATNEEDPVYVKLKPRFHAETLPTLVIIDSQGKIITSLHEFISPNQLLPLLQTVK